MPSSWGLHGRYYWAGEMADGRAMAHLNLPNPDTGLTPIADGESFIRESFTAGSPYMTQFADTCKDICDDDLEDCDGFTLKMQDNMGTTYSSTPAGIPSGWDHMCVFYTGTYHLGCDVGREIGEGMVMEMNDGECETHYVLPVGSEEVTLRDTYECFVSTRSYRDSDDGNNDEEVDLSSIANAASSVTDVFADAGEAVSDAFSSAAEALADVFSWGRRRVVNRRTIERLDPGFRSVESELDVN